MLISDNGAPRRIRMDLYSPAEKAISDAMAAVEKAGAHPLLTDAVTLLAQAKDKIADYVDLTTDFWCQDCNATGKLSDGSECMMCREIVPDNQMGDVLQDRD